MTSPWLSVIMPTFNGEAYIRVALESIVAQHDDRMEVIAVDDASTDSTVSILESFAARLPLAVHRRERTGNWVAGTNYGLSIARGDYISFLHQDDLWMAGRLAALSSVLANASSATMVVHPSWFLDSQGKRLGRWRCPLPGGELDEKMLFERLLIQNFIAIPAPIFRREAALDAGGMDESLWYTADWDLWLKLARLGKAIYLPRTLSGFRISGESQTMKRSVRREDFRRQLEVVLERYLAPRADIGPAVRRAARFSVDLNTALAARAHGQRESLLPLAYRFLALGPAAGRRYLRDSRVVERVSARVRAGLSGRSTN